MAPEQRTVPLKTKRSIGIWRLNRSASLLDNRRASTCRLRSKRSGAPAVRHSFTVPCSLHKRATSTCEARRVRQVAERADALHLMPVIIIIIARPLNCARISLFYGKPLYIHIERIFFFLLLFLPFFYL